MTVFLQLAGAVIGGVALAELTTIRHLRKKI